MLRFILICLSLITSPQLALATSPPAECFGDTLIGFEPAYPNAPIGYLTWGLVLFGFYLSLNSHRTVRMVAEKREEKLSSFWLNMVTGLGALLTVAGTCLGLILIFSATFRNNCILCLIERPKITLLNELSVVIPTIIMTMVLRWPLKLISSLSVRHWLHLPLLIFVWFAWVVLTYYVNLFHLAKYCQPLQ